MNLWLLVITYVICSAAGLILIKGSFVHHKLESLSLWKMEGLLHLASNGSFIVGCILYILGFFIWLYILNKWDLSVAFPIASGALYGGLLFGSVFLLHESIGVVRLVGIFLILTGIFLVSRC